MPKSKILTIIIVLGVFMIFSGIAAVAIIISRGGVITDEGIVLDSGVIRIQTDPEDIEANYYLNDELIVPQDGRIYGLVDGIYKFRIEAAEYAAWEKEIRIDSGLVNDIYAKLYPNELQINQLTNTNIEKAFFSKSGEFAYYFVTDSVYGTNIGLWKTRISQSNFLFNSFNSSSPEKIMNLTPAIRSVLAENDYDLIISSDHNRLILHDNSTDNWFLLSPTNIEEEVIINLNNSFGYDPQDINFYDKSNSIIIRSSNILFEYDIATKVSTVISYNIDDEIIYSNNDNSIFVYNQQTNTLYEYLSKKLNKVTIENIQLPKDIVAIYSPQDEDRFMLLETKNTFYYLDLERSLIEQVPGTDLKYYTISNDGRSVLFSKGDQVFSYTVKEVIARDNIETKLTDTGFVIDSRNDKVGFVPQSTHIIHYNYDPTTANTLTISDKDGSNKIVLLRNNEELVSNFSVNSSGSTLIVLLTDELANGQTTSSNLYSIDLLNPKTSE